jgi:tripartite ATP-independent transporter DctM subunit
MQILGIVKRCLVVAFMPIIVVIGVTTGIFTATESAAVASAYAFVICFVVFRTLSFKDFPDIIFQTAKVSSLIILLLATSTVFSYVLATENVPVRVGEFLQAITANKYVFLLIANIALLLIGCVIDTFPAILIFAPIFVPIANSYGIDPLHFGVVFCVNLLIGLNTPPVGTGLFIGSAIGKVSIEKLIREVLPFTAVQLVVLVLITYFPWFTVTVPKLAGF